MDVVASVWERFWLVFIPLCVAFDALGLLPLFWGLSEGIPAEQRRQAIHKAAFISAFIGPAFLLVSEWIFKVLGIQLADMMVAGGTILFMLAMSDLLHIENRTERSADALGVVPLAVPLIVGPAVLTTLLLLRQHYGVWLTWSAFNVNVLLTWCLLLSAEHVARWLGREGARVVSKVASLVLAAFGVMLVREGISAWWSVRS